LNRIKERAERAEAEIKRNPSEPDNS